MACKPPVEDVCCKPTDVPPGYPAHSLRVINLLQLSHESRLYAMLGKLERSCGEQRGNVCVRRPARFLRALRCLKFRALMLPADNPGLTFVAALANFAEHE
jgi:hypothetical protein